MIIVIIAFSVAHVNKILKNRSGGIEKCCYIHRLTRNNTRCFLKCSFLFLLYILCTHSNLFSLYCVCTLWQFNDLTS